MAGLAGAEGGQLGDINKIFPFARQVGCHQEGEERDQHWGGWGVQGSILWDSISPHLALPVLVSLSTGGSWAINPLLLFYFCIFNIKGCWWLGARGGSRPQVGWTARCCGVGPRSPGAGWCRQPAVPFPCSAVLRGQEGLHCKMAFQDFLRQPLEQDAAAHRLPGEPAACMDAGVVWGPYAALFQAAPRANLGACGPGNPKWTLQSTGQFPWHKGGLRAGKEVGAPSALA